jgi:hypothetical protein
VLHVVLCIVCILICHCHDECLIVVLVGLNPKPRSQNPKRREIREKGKEFKFPSHTHLATFANHQTRPHLIVPWFAKHLDINNTPLWIQETKFKSKKISTSNTHMIMVIWPFYNIFTSFHPWLWLFLNQTWSTLATSSKILSRWTTLLLTTSVDSDQVDQKWVDKMRLWNKEKITPNLKSCKSSPNWPPPTPNYFFNYRNEIHQKEFQNSKKKFMRPLCRTHGRQQFWFAMHLFVQQILG